MASVSTDNKRILLYDGVCKLCNGWVRFLIRHDRYHTVQLAAVQTEPGAELLKKVGMTPEKVNTLVLMEGDKTWYRAQAIFRVMNRLPLPWRLFSVLRWFPDAISNRCYDLIASRRYRLFGRYDELQRPEADYPGRFLAREPEGK